MPVVWRAVASVSHTWSPIAVAVGGVVVMRYGENPREVIARVKTKIAALESELAGIKIQGVYDRTLLIEETVSTLSDALAQEILITIAVMVLFLLHVRASIVIAITLPIHSVPARLETRSVTFAIWHKVMRGSAGSTASRILMSGD